MGSDERFNPRFDFRKDAGGGDANGTSPTLRSYHRLLWQKPLPGGAVFTLRDESECGEYLVHETVLDRFSLLSDSGVPTWSTWARPRISEIVGRVAEGDIARFDTLSCQMGAVLLFPCNSPQEFRGRSVNQDRGASGYIVDRLDLTLECIRLHYFEKAQPGSTVDNPLADTLNRWSDFFDLFEDFHGYVDFFLLQDLLTPDGGAVDFFLPFCGFTWWPFPADVDEYATYMKRAIAFVQARNRRMTDWLDGTVSTHPNASSSGSLQAHATGASGLLSISGLPQTPRLPASV